MVLAGAAISAAATVFLDVFSSSLLLAAFFILRLDDGELEKLKCTKSTYIRPEQKVDTFCNTFFQYIRHPISKKTMRQLFQRRRRRRQRLAAASSKNVPGAPVDT